MARLRGIILKAGTPTAYLRNGDGTGKKTKINGVPVWIKGSSPARQSDNNSPLCERAAYLVDKMLRFRFVPTTVLRLKEGRLVSAQRWVKGSFPECSRNPAMLRLFDYIIANGDRHGSNWLIGKYGKIWAIDNAMTFDTNDWNYSYGAELEACKDLSKAERTKVKKSIKLVLANKKELHNKLDCLIGKDKTDALIKRMKNVGGKV